jgi:hypothetical protein
LKLIDRDDEKLVTASRLKRTNVHLMHFRYLNAIFGLFKGIQRTFVVEKKLSVATKKD